MIQKFVDRFMANEQDVRARLAKQHWGDYEDIVRIVVETVADPDDYDRPDPERIHVINDGSYQGTLVYVIGASGYQPDAYWYVKVGYGSCSGCDTLEAISCYSDDPPTSEQANDYWTLALHIVQGLAAMQAETV